MPELVDVADIDLQRPTKTKATKKKKSGRQDQQAWRVARLDARHARMWGGGGRSEEKHRRKKYGADLH